MESDYDYDIAVSFAGEQRTYVKEVVASLKGQSLRVFFDLDERIALWAENNIIKLQEIYGEKSRHCVMFISKEYVDKIFTIHESKIILNRCLREGRNPKYLLPVRFDETPLPGLDPDVGFIPAPENPDELAHDIIEKVKSLSARKSDTITDIYHYLLAELDHLDIPHIRLERKNLFQNSEEYRLFRYGILIYYLQIRLEGSGSSIHICIYDGYEEPKFYNDVMTAELFIDDNPLNNIHMINYGFAENGYRFNVNKEWIIHNIRQKLGCCK